MKGTWMPLWDDILTPTIFWPRGQNIVRYLTPLPSRYFHPPQIIDDKVLFAFHIYLIRSIIKIVSMILEQLKCFYFDTTKSYPNSTQGSKYRMIFWPPLDIFTAL